MFWPMHWFGGIFCILISILIIVIIVRIIVRISTGGRYRHHHWHDYYHDESKNSAFNILQERYAKGEITKEQYESIKKDLGY
jgi:putative membrane protein